MSGLAAILGAAGSAEESAGTAMLGRLNHRGADQHQWWSGEAGRIGVCRWNWELGSGFADGMLILEQGSLIVAADASLYYVQDLMVALNSVGVVPQGNSPSHLIAAAYLAWADRLVDHLEGDYAFVIWDRQQQRLLAARDFAGSRPLYFASAGSRLILASTPVAVVAHPAVSRELNLLSIAEDLIGSSSMALTDTAFSSVQRLPAGWRLDWEPGRTASLIRCWSPPRFEQDPSIDPSEAAGELRRVLGSAVGQRMDRLRPTAVWTSGGYDSPAIFALAASAARTDQLPAAFPVSMSYPPGDPGREDELIQKVGDFVGSPIHWLDIATVPGLPDPWKWAEERDDPFAHPYEEWNRALARVSREAGARVILGGNGGDQFFGVSPVFLADLFRTGRWPTLIAEIRGLGFGSADWKSLFHWAIQPSLPAPLMGLAKLVRGGRPLRAHLQSPIPDWLTIDRQTANKLWDRQWNYGLRETGESLSSAETRWYLSSSFGQRIATSVVGFAQQTGVEARSPMYDLRVLEFMAKRPRIDRFANGETKRLLRKAMVGVLPDEHLAPRKTRTGLPSAYLHRVRLAALPAWWESLDKRLLLHDLGLVSLADFQAGMGRFLQRPEWEGRLGGQLFNILVAEFWLRAHSGLK